MKITNKKELMELLLDIYLEDGQPEAIAESACILSNESYDQLLSEYQGYEAECGEENVTLLEDVNFGCIAGYLIDCTKEDIKYSFDNYYSPNVLAVAEDGRGFMYIAY